MHKFFVPSPLIFLLLPRNLVFHGSFGKRQNGAVRGKHVHCALPTINMYKGKFSASCVPEDRVSCRLSSLFQVRILMM
jgi:hypothetical protein